MIKDIKFTGRDDPRIPRSVRKRFTNAFNRAETDEERQHVSSAFDDWIDQEQERLEVVAICELCTPAHPLMRSELIPHKLTHVKSARARQIIGMLLSYKTSTEAAIEVRDFLI